MARLQRDPVPVRKLRPGVPRQLDDLIMQLLARNADDRPRNAALVRDALMRLLETGADEDATVIVSSRQHPRSSACRCRAHRGVPKSDDPTYPGGLVEVRSPRRYLVSIVVLCTIAAVLVVAGAVLFRTDTGARLVRSAREAIAAAPSPRPRQCHRRAPPTRAVVVSSGEFDPPPGGDGRENPDQTGFLTDGNPDTVVVHRLLQRPQPGTEAGRRRRARAVGSTVDGHTLVVTSPTTGGWGADVYVSDTTHDTLSAWGDARRLDRTTRPPGQTRFDLGAASGRYVLLFVTELGESVAPCQRPWQVRIGEVAVT